MPGTHNDNKRKEDTYKAIECVWFLSFIRFFVYLLRHSHTFRYRTHITPGRMCFAFFGCTIAASQWHKTEQLMYSQGTVTQ